MPREPSLTLVGELRALVAELLGTFALTFVGAGAIMVDEASGHALGYIPRVVSPGILVMALIYTLVSRSLLLCAELFPGDEFQDTGSRNSPVLSSHLSSCKRWWAESRTSVLRFRRRESGRRSLWN